MRKLAFVVGLFASFLLFTTLAITAAAETRDATPARAPVAGNAGFLVMTARATRVNLIANQIVYDVARDVIYGSVAGAQGQHGNSIVPVFRDGQKGSPLFVGSEPNVLAISADGQFLYVGLDGAGAVRRVALHTMTLDVPQWSLGMDPISGIRTAGDMVVLTDNPHAVAVVRKPGGGWPDVAIYDNGVMRPTVTEIVPRNDAIEPLADPARLIGYDSQTSASTLQTLAVESDGVTSTGTYPNLIGWYSNDIRYADGHIFSIHGDVIDATTLTLHGRFAVNENSMPVIRDGRAFSITYNQILSRFELQAFDVETLRLLTSSPIEGLFDAHTKAKNMQLIDAGPNRMGIRTSEDEVFLLEYKLYEHAAFLPAISRGLWEPDAQ